MILGLSAFRLDSRKAIFEQATGSVHRTTGVRTECSEILEDGGKYSWVELDQDLLAARLGQIVGDRWRLRSLLGVGGMAAVYAAEDREGRRAAVKLLHPEMGLRRDIKERFLREAQAATTVGHPGAVAIIDQGQTGETIFLVMELLEGESVAERVRQRGRLPVSEVLSILDQVLDVLVAAHARGVVHRDLKPENLFLTTDGRAKVLDFGLARLLEGGPRDFRTRTGTALGTLPYMAPEQALGRRDEIDARTDLFAMGATAFRLLSGRRIHDAPSEAELLMAMASKPAPSLLSVAPDVPTDLALVVDRALCFERLLRYPDASTMQRDVRAISSGERPPHVLSRLAAEGDATCVDRPAPRTAPPTELDPLSGRLVSPTTAPAEPQPVSARRTEVMAAVTSPPPSTASMPEVARASALPTVADVPPVTVGSVDSTLPDRAARPPAPLPSGTSAPMSPYGSPVSPLGFGGTAPPSSAPAVGFAGFAPQATAPGVGMSGVPQPPFPGSVVPAGAPGGGRALPIGLAIGLGLLLLGAVAAAAMLWRVTRGASATELSSAAAGVSSPGGEASSPLKRTGTFRETASGNHSLSSEPASVLGVKPARRSDGATSSLAPAGGGALSVPARPSAVGASASALPVVGAPIAVAPGTAPPVTGGGATTTVPLSGPAPVTVPQTANPVATVAPGVVTGAPKPTAAGVATPSSSPSPTAAVSQPASTPSPVVAPTASSSAGSGRRGKRPKTPVADPAHGPR